MEEITWYEEKLPKNLTLATVHAVIVTKDGRVLIRYKNGNVRKVTGGHIEPDDKDIEAALKREILEEINCKIDKCDYLGYIIYRAPDGTEEVRLRMVARLAEVGSAQPDPACEDTWTYGRAIMSPEEAESEAVEDEQFAKIMPRIMKLALEAAEKNGYFTEPISKEKEVINLEEHITK